MLTGTIPIYYGQKDLNYIPDNTYIRINKNVSAKDIIQIVEETSSEVKKKYRRNIYEFLSSELADRYRYEKYAKFIIKIINS